jgi:AbrB family looped-hinge helix DNA binding protein
MARFKARLVRWGNSVGINLPKPIRDSLDLNVGDEVEIVDNQDIITIRKL